MVQDWPRPTCSHDGYYDVRVTAELWEVYYYDYIGMMTVDHPVGYRDLCGRALRDSSGEAGLYDRRRLPHDIARATDDTGRDVTTLVSTLDGKALGRFRTRAISRRELAIITWKSIWEKTTRSWPSLLGRARLDSRHGVLDQCGDHTGYNVGDAHGLSVEVSRRT